MANNTPNLKVRATMDNSDLKKKSQESKAALRDFEKSGSEAVGKLGEAFGVNTGKVEQMLSSVRGLGVTLSESGNAGAAAFGKMLQGITGVSAGIAGLGLAGALATFKLLSAEAENFKNTVAGANIELATTAYVDTYRQVIHDFNKELGEGFADTESSWKKFWGTIGSTMKAYLTSGAAFQGAMPGASTVAPMGGGMAQTNSFLTVIQEAKEAAATAEEISNKIYETQRRISDASVEWARTEREIAEYKRIAYDKNNDLATQQEALSKAVELTKQRYEEEAELRKQLADLQEEMNGLAESSVADIDKANQLRMQEESVIARMNNALREMSERQASIAKDVQKEAEARAAALLAAQQMAELRASHKEWTDTSTVGTVETPGATAMNTPGISVPVKMEPTYDTKALVATAEEMASLVSSAFSSMAESLGGLIGDLINGQNAWDNFGASAISSLADLAISFGKVTLASGIAATGILEALTLNPAVAIAAGAALIAVGSAIKAGLNNIANGNYSASNSVATATGSYGGSSGSSVALGLESREITVNVTGTLRASGNQLLTVIENENKRTKHTT